MSAFFLQNCATIVRGTSQNIPVTSNPVGAKIAVDGEEMGYAPIELKLKRKKDHIIRIEKQGYNPLEIRIIRKSSKLLSYWGNFSLGGIFSGTFLGIPLVYILGTGENGSVEKFWAGFWLGAIIGAVVGGVALNAVDAATGADHNLFPDNLVVTLSKIEEKPQPHFILVDTEKLQNMKWIRIICADSDKGGIVNLK